MEFIAATNNPGKMAEFRRILTRLGHTVQSQKEAGVALEPEETGETFSENAQIKACAICEATGKATIADDSGLCVDILDGAPGVYSARYCGHHGDDEANNDKLLQTLADVPEGQRAAQFVSCVCAVLSFAANAQAVSPLSAGAQTALGMTRFLSPTRLAYPVQIKRCRMRRAVPTLSFQRGRKTPSATGGARSR